MFARITWPPANELARGQRVEAELWRDSLEAPKRERVYVLRWLCADFWPKTDRNSPPQPLSPFNSQPAKLEALKLVVSLRKLRDPRSEKPQTKGALGRRRSEAAQKLESGANLNMLKKRVQLGARFGLKTPGTA